MMKSSNNFEIYVKHRSVVPDNLRCWQVFWDDNEINSFLQGDGKFKDTPIEGEYEERITSVLIRGKDAKISEIQDNCLVNLVCPKLLHLICQSGIRKLMKCGALYVQDNLFLNFLSFLVF